MFVVYMHCRASSEGDPPGFVIAADYYVDLTERDYDLSRNNESLWIVPGTIEGETRE